MAIYHCPLPLLWMGAPRTRKLVEVRPDLAGEWDEEGNSDISIYDLGSMSGLRVWWRCGTCGHRWQAAVNNRARGSGCPQCWRQRRQRREQVLAGHPLAETDRHLLREWDFARNERSPFDLSRGANWEAWWICSECAHRWPARVPNRTLMGSGCPACGHRLSPGEAATHR
jgi:predicted  nucleic acid-binding Zn-ribbon protein